MEERFFELKASILKVFGQPTRMKILECLRIRPAQRRVRRMVPVRLEAVSASYDAAHVRQPASWQLRDVDLRIEPGELLGSDHPGPVRLPPLGPREEGRAVGAHEGRGVRPDGLAARDELEGAEHRLELKKRHEHLRKKEEDLLARKEKRSEINEIVREADSFIRQRGFYLPPFAYWTPADWVTKGEEAREIVENQLGWDITDFGQGRYESYGLFLFTVRNGSLAEMRAKQGKLYCEKIMVVGVDQVTLMHFHWNKMEDIINRGGGKLVIQLFNATD
jgi:hypothetical protein